MRKVICPHCHGSGKVALRIDLPVELTPLGAEIYRRVKASPGVMDGPRLAELLYADRHDGGPDNPLNVVYVTIKKTNERLLAVGERVHASRRGPGATYSVVKI